MGLIFYIEKSLKAFEQINGRIRVAFRKIVLSVVFVGVSVRSKRRGQGGVLRGLLPRTDMKS